MPLLSASFFYVLHCCLFADVDLQREAQGPALTITVKRPGHHDISVDITASVPCDLSVSRGGWPRSSSKMVFTEEQIDETLGAGMHLVPKWDETWSISYSKAERALFEIIDKGHHCRRKVMQIIKRYVEICRSRAERGEFQGISSHIVKVRLIVRLEKNDIVKGCA